MKTYDEIVENVIEATAAHRRRVKRIQTITATSVMCAVCVFGLSVFLNLEPPQTLPEFPDETHTSTIGSTAGNVQPSTEHHNNQQTTEGEVTATVTPSVPYPTFTDSPPAHTEQNPGSGNSVATDPVEPQPSETAPPESNTQPNTSDSADSPLNTTNPVELQPTFPPDSTEPSEPEPPEFEPPEFEPTEAEPPEHEPTEPQTNPEIEEPSMEPPPEEPSTNVPTEEDPDPGYSGGEDCPAPPGNSETSTEIATQQSTVCTTITSDTTTTTTTTTTVTIPSSWYYYVIKRDSDNTVQTEVTTVIQ